MLPKAEWLQRAKGIPIGTTEKVVHGFGCRSKRPAMSLYNDGDKWSCWCHACNDGGWEDKTRPQIVRVKQKTGWFPKDMRPLVEVLAENPMEFQHLFKMNRELIKSVGSLKADVNTGRIYFPDETNSFMGMDYTGQANAKMYSPEFRKVAGVWSDDSLHKSKVIFTGWVDDYLRMIASGHASFLVIDMAGFSHALATLLRELPNADAYVGNGLSKRMRLELQPFT